MSAIEFPDYWRYIENALNEAVAAGYATTVHLETDQRSATIGSLSGSVCFLDSSELHFREYIDLAARPPRQMYAYHYQDTDNLLVFRYDNAAHRPPLDASEHKHTRAGIVIGLSPTLEQVLDEIPLYLERAARG